VKEIACMKTPTKVESRKRRKGAIAAITAVLLLAILGMVACSLDIGWIAMTRTQLQAVADASSLAAGTELMPGLGFFKTKTPAEIVDAATPIAVEYAAHNRNAELSASFIDGDRDVEFGKATFDADGCNCWQKTPASENPEYYNYVEVKPLRNQSGSGSGDRPAPLFFARIFGINEASMSATATAAILAANGFRVVEEDDKANVMPFAFNEKYWDRFERAQEYYDDHPGMNLNNWNTLQTIKDVNGSEPTAPLFGALDVINPTNPPVQLMFDGFTRTESGAVSSGADGQLEVNIFTGKLPASGNWGTVDFGSASNSASEVRRQIREGLNAQDLSHYDNNQLVLNENDPFNTGGDTGEYSPFKAAFDDVVGQCKAIALFTSVSGSGKGANFELVKFVSATVVRVNLTGNPNNREVRVQRCLLVDNSTVPDTENPIDDNTTIFTPLILIR
jgi:Flp pilus assembly protein TadG